MTLSSPTGNITWRLPSDQGPNVTDPFNETQVNWKHDHHIWRPGVGTGNGGNGGNGNGVECPCCVETFAQASHQMSGSTIVTPNTDIYLNTDWNNNVFPPYLSQNLLDKPGNLSAGIPVLEGVWVVSWEIILTIYGGGGATANTTPFWIRGDIRSNGGGQQVYSFVQIPLRYYGQTQIMDNQDEVIVFRGITPISCWVAPEAGPDWPITSWPRLSIYLRHNRVGGIGNRYLWFNLYWLKCLDQEPVEPVNPISEEKSE